MQVITISQNPRIQTALKALFQTALMIIMTLQNHSGQILEDYRLEFKSFNYKPNFLKRN